MTRIWPKKGTISKHILRPGKELIGRQQDLERFLDIFALKDARLFTIVGPAGVGKTQFALQLAYHLQSSFPDGVYPVFLDSLADPRLVFPTLLQILGITLAHSLSASETLCAFLSEKKLLLLLDNFEHLIPAASLLPSLLAACPDLVILVTSRSALRVPEEQQFPLPPLPLPDLLSQTSAILVQNPAVALFLACTRIHQPSFQLTAENVKPVVQICTYLGGLPLALELAATTGMQLFPPQTLLTCLEHHRLQVLLNDERDRPARQQTWNTTIDWSYSLLSPAAQRLFRCLALFPGGATLEALEAVSQRNGEKKQDLVETLKMLVNHHLVLSPSTSPTDPVHFRMLPVIRSYGRNRLDTEAETSPTVQAYITYFLALVKQIEPQLAGATQLQGLDLLQQEQDNLRAAYTWLLERHEIEYALQFTASLWRFWAYRGFVSEGYQQITHVLHHAQNQMVSKGVLARAHYAAALLDFFQHSIASMSEHLQTCIHLYREEGNRTGTAIALTALGYCELFQGHYEAVRVCYEESLPLLQEARDDWHLAEVYGLIAGEAQAQGNYGQAQKLYEQSLTLIRNVGDRRALIQGLDFLAQIFLQQKEYGKALHLYKEKTFIAIELGGQPLIATSLEVMGEIALLLGLHQWAALLGGAAGVLRETHWSVISHEEQQRSERIHAQLRVTLDQQTLTAIWAQGGTMTPQQALLAAPNENALEHQIAFIAPPSHNFSRHIAQYPDDLTVREGQVLQLVADGFTNKQIAEKLVISHHTVNTHLNKIYDKIHVTSRNGAIRYALEHQLFPQKE